MSWGEWPLAARVPPARAHTAGSSGRWVIGDRLDGAGGEDLLRGAAGGAHVAGRGAEQLGGGGAVDVPAVVERRDALGGGDADDREKRGDGGQVDLFGAEHGDGGGGGGAGRAEQFDKLGR